MTQRYLVEVMPSGEVVFSTSLVEGMSRELLRGGFHIESDECPLPGRHFYDGTRFISIPESSNLNLAFNYETKEWEDPRSLEDLQTLKWSEIKSHRDAEEFGPFVYNGMTFDGDAVAQRRLMVYISVSKSAIAQGIEFSREFTLANNTEVTLQANDFVAIELAKANQVAEVFEKAALLRQQIYAATSKEELEAIVWDTVSSN